MSILGHEPTTPTIGLPKWKYKTQPKEPAASKRGAYSDVTDLASSPDALVPDRARRLYDLLSSEPQGVLAAAAATLMKHIVEEPTLGKMAAIEVVARCNPAAGHEPLCRFLGLRPAAKAHLYALSAARIPGLRQPCGAVDSAVVALLTDLKQASLASSVSSEILAEGFQTLARIAPDALLGIAAEHIPPLGDFSETKLWRSVLHASRQRPQECESLRGLVGDRWKQLLRPGAGETITNAAGLGAIFFELQVHLGASAMHLGDDLKSSPMEVRVLYQLFSEKDPVHLDREIYEVLLGRVLRGLIVTKQLSSAGTLVQKYSKTNAVADMMARAATD